MSIPLRWRLLDEETGAILTDCTDIDGLFTDRVFPNEPLYERYTLLSSAPSGPLRVAIDGTGPTWFGNVVIEGAHVSGRPASERCEASCQECYESTENLLDVRVAGHRPAADGSGLLDIDLEGHRRDDDNNRGGTVAPAVFGYRLFAWSTANEEMPAGECRDIAGLFHERPDSWPPGPQLTLLGCRPGLSGSFDAELAHDSSDVAGMPISARDRHVTASSNQTLSTKVACFTRPSSVVREATNDRRACSSVSPSKQPLSAPRCSSRNASNWARAGCATTWSAKVGG